MIKCKIFSGDARELYGLHSDRMLRKFVWNFQDDTLNYKDCVKYELDKLNLI